MKWKTIERIATMLFLVFAAWRCVHRSSGGLPQILVAARKPLVIVSGQTEQIADTDYMTVPGGITTNGTAATTGDLETTTNTFRRNINMVGVPTVVCDDGSPVPIGGQSKGFVTPAADVTTCALTFGNNIASCGVTFHAMKVEVATGTGPTYSWAGSVLTVTRAPTWTTGPFDYDCSFTN